MQDDKDKSESFNTDSSSTDNTSYKGKGPDGVDKAPGEETTQENVQFVQETQKGKKVDRDPSEEEEEPLQNQDI